MTSLSTATTAPRFSRLRFALLVLAGVYPLITGLLYVLFPLTDGWSIWQRTAVIAPIMVVVMVWGMIPAIQHHFRGFLSPLSGCQRPSAASSGMRLKQPL